MFVTLKPFLCSGNLHCSFSGYDTALFLSTFHHSLALCEKDGSFVITIITEANVPTYLYVTCTACFFLTHSCYIAMSH